MEALLAGLLSAIAVLELLGRLTGSQLVLGTIWIAMGLVCLLSLRRLGLREYYLLSASAVLTVVDILVLPEPARAIRQGLEQASFLMAFILLLGLLHEVASMSPSIATCGEYLTRQPPGRRYYALNIGSALMAVLFNLGVVSFLVPLIQGGIEKTTPGDPLNPIRERRQLSAILRGFAWCVIWSPTALAPLTLAEILPGADRGRWLQYGLVIFAVVAVLGALEDRFRYRGLRPSGKRPQAMFPTGAVLKFAAACAWLFGMASLFTELSGESFVFGLLLACPVMVIGWLAVLNGFPRRASGRSVALRMGLLLHEGLPQSIPVAVTLACSGYIGRTAAGLVPVEQLAALLRIDTLPDFVLLSAIPPVISLFSLLALSPIMLAVFLGSLFAALPQLPASPTLIALAISCGWALSMTFSPFATVVLLINRVAGIPATRLTWRWNLGFTLICAVTLVPAFGILTGWQ